MHTDSKLSAYLKSTGLLLNGNLDKLQIDLPYEDITIGRGLTNDVCINIRTVSNHHAHISFEKDHWFVTDLDSKNGILVNEYKIESTYELKEKDTVSIGGVEFNFLLNKPQVLLRQDSISLKIEKQLLSQNEKLQGINETMHFDSLDLSSTLKQTKYQKIKRYFSDLFMFNKKMIMTLFLFSLLIGYLFFQFGNILNSLLF